MLIAIAGAGCAELRSEPSFAVEDRLIRHVTDTVAVIGGSEQDTLLFTPTMVALSDDAIAVWDRDRGQVLAFGRDGSPRWRYGGKGSGPGEFAAVTQLAVDDENRIWVLDPDNARISILDGDGRLNRAFRIPDVAHADRLAPLGDGRALLMGLDPIVHVIDDHGTVLSSRSHPYAAYATLNPLSAYNRALYDAASDSLVFFFYYGGGFARTDRALSSTAQLDAYVEPIPFPEVIVDRTDNGDGSFTTTTMVNATRLAASNGSVADGVVSLLFQGDTEYAHRLIDNYSIGSGEYLGSWLLPDTARAMAVADGLIVTVVENPYPALIIRRAP